VKYSIERTKTVQRLLLLLLRMNAIATL